MFIESCLNIFSDFEHVSGSKLNLLKTEGLVKNENKEMCFNGITLTAGPEIVLRVLLGKTKNISEFWETLTKKMQLKINI